MFAKRNPLTKRHNTLTKCLGLKFSGFTTFIREKTKKLYRGRKIR